MCISQKLRLGFYIKPYLVSMNYCYMEVGMGYWWEHIFSTAVKVSPLDLEWSSELFSRADWCEWFCWAAYQRLSGRALCGMPWVLDSTPPLGNDWQQRAVEIRLAVVPVAHYHTGRHYRAGLCGPGRGSKEHCTLGDGLSWVVFTFSTFFCGRAGDCWVVQGGNKEGSGPGLWQGDTL